MIPKALSKVVCVWQFQTPYFCFMNNLYHLKAGLNKNPCVFLLQMNISLKNHVVVLDEAHNIEDSAREAASCTITQELLIDASKHLRERETCVEECEKLVRF